MTRHETKLNLSGQKLKLIPDSVFDKIDLVYLDLGSSDVVFYPPISALVDSNANDLTDIPEKIGKLINLKTLVLNSNKLMTIPNSITQLTNLEVLDLSINRDLDIAKEIEKIKQLPKLKTLKIVDVKLSKDNIDTIKKALRPETKVILTIADYLESPK